MIQVKNLKLMSSLFHHRLDISELKLNLDGIVALVGHNGAGKSSLLRIMAGIEKPHEGFVIYNDEPIFENYEKYKNKIHLLTPQKEMFSQISAMDHLNFIKSISHTWNTEIENDLQNEFKIPIFKKVDQLSRGELSKLKILLSLPRQPEFIFTDELTNDLDTDSRRSIFQKLDSYSFHHKTKVLVATNMIEDVERYATNVILLKNGKIVLKGNLDQLKEEKKLSLVEMIRQFE